MHQKLKKETTAIVIHQKNKPEAIFWKATKISIDWFETNKQGCRLLPERGGISYVACGCNSVVVVIIGK